MTKVVYGDPPGVTMKECKPLRRWRIQVCRNAIIQTSHEPCIKPAGIRSVYMGTAPFGVECVSCCRGQDT